MGCGSKIIPLGKLLFKPVSSSSANSKITRTRNTTYSKYSSGQCCLFFWTIILLLAVAAKIEQCGIIFFADRVCNKIDIRTSEGAHQNYKKT